MNTIKIACFKPSAGVGKLRPATTFCAAREGFKQILKKIIKWFLSSTKFLVIAFSDN